MRVFGGAHASAPGPGCANSKKQCEVGNDQCAKQQLWLEHLKKELQAAEARSGVRSDPKSLQ